MSVFNSVLYEGEEYMCKICGHTFSTAQSLAAHIDSEHPEAEQPEIF
jgi:Zinc finger, C2H2 type